MTFREPGEYFVRVTHPDHAPAELGPYFLDPEQGRDGGDDQDDRAEAVNSTLF